MIPQADSEGPDQTAQMHRQILAFYVRIRSEDTFYHGVTHIILQNFTVGLHVSISVIKIYIYSKYSCWIF